MSTALSCPECGLLHSKVVDSRSTHEGTMVLRRRECLSCKFRWSTAEVTVDGGQSLAQVHMVPWALRKVLSMRLRRECSKIIRSTLNEQTMTLEEALGTKQTGTGSHSTAMKGD